MSVRELAKTQADLVNAEAPLTRGIASETMEDLPGLKNILASTDEEKKEMFTMALRSRPFVSKFELSLGDFKDTKTELLSLDGMQGLHTRSYEEIASVFVGVMKTKKDFVGFTYEIREDKAGKVQGRLELEFGAKVTPSSKGFAPKISLEYMK